MVSLSANPTIDELLTALKLKLEDGHGVRIAYETENFSDSALRRNTIPLWSQRLEESKRITDLLQRTVNSLPVVNHLPFEILGQIFLTLQIECSTRDFKLPPAKYDLFSANAWINVTHVCQRWRHCAHNTKALWSRITLGTWLKHPAFLANSFFARSHPLSIALEQDLDTLSQDEEEEMNKFYLSLMENRHRISALYFQGCLPNMAWKILRVPLPNVTEVQLFFERMKTTPLSVVKGGKIENFLGGHSSTLQRLWLADYRWPRQTFPSLTHLYLSHEVGEFVRDHEFYEILNSLSTTLQLLFLRDAGPLISNPEAFAIFPKNQRISMPALLHFELHLPDCEDGDHPLLLLYNLSLPKTTTIIWDRRITKNLLKYIPNNLGKSMIPPEEHRERVLNLVGWEYRKLSSVYTISGNTLNFSPRYVHTGILARWSKLLPNVVTLALPVNLKAWRSVVGQTDMDMYQQNTRKVLTEYTTLKSLHFSSYRALAALLSDLEKELEDDQNINFCPQLETLVVYTGDLELSFVHSNIASEELVRQGLEPLHLSADSSMTRARPQLRTAYILCFKAGSIDGPTFDH